MELWVKITAYACTDGGYTGRSLSLVSRTMHSIIKPVRYNSVALIGNRKLLAFSEQLAAMRAAPLVRHLFIADIDPFTNSCALDDLEGDMYDDERWEEVYRRKEDRVRQLNWALHKVLTSSAPYLYTLSVHGWSFDPTLDLPVFPHLNDLTLLAAPQTWAAEAHACLPSLRRLHILSAHTSPQFWLSLADSAPHLTHLKLTNVSQDSHLGGSLRALLDVKSSGSSDDPIPPRRDEQALAAASRLSALEFVYVHPATYRSSGRRGTGSLIHSHMMYELISIAEAAEHGDCVGHFVFTPHLTYYTVDNAHKDWLDTAEGSSRSWPEAVGSPKNPRPASLRRQWAKEGPSAPCTRTATANKSSRGGSVGVATIWS